MSNSELTSHAAPRQPGDTSGAPTDAFDDVQRRVSVLYEGGQVDDARRLLEGHLRRSTVPDAGTLNDLGVILVERGDIDEAVNCFARALKTYPTYGIDTVLGNLAYTLFLQGRRHASLKFCNRTLEAAPGETRAHYLMSVNENMLYGSRRVSATDVIREGDGLWLFRALRFWNEPMRKVKGKSQLGTERLLQVLEPVSVSRAGIHWGVLYRYRDELWCGFTRQSCAVGEDVGPLVDMPARLHVVQRRRWVRVLDSGALVRLEVMSLPGGGAMDLSKAWEVNLSAGGAAIRTEPELPVNAHVSLILDLGEVEHLEVQARVIRVVRPAHGAPFLALAFFDTQARQRERIAQFLHRIQLQRKRGNG